MSDIDEVFPDTDAKVILYRAKVHARQNLKACCQEILDFKATSILPADAKVREVAKILQEAMPGSQCLSLAEVIVTDWALQYAAQHS